MSKSVTFIVRTFMDTDRPSALLKEPNTWLLSRHWVKARIRLYHELTLKSILNQSFQDFRILVLCGQRHKETTQKIKWHPRVEVCYDEGRAVYESIQTDYLSVTRIDSDDLMHRDVMAEVRDNQIHTNGRACLVFNKCLSWRIPDRLLSIHHRNTPPTFTHIFPKSIYHNWSLLYKQHFLSHGRACRNGRKELSKNRYCIVKHWLGNCRIRHGQPLHVMSEEERQTVAKKYPQWVVLDREKIKEILKDFAVDEKWIK